MKHIILATLLCLSACGSNDSLVLRSPRHMVVMPDEEMFSCNAADTFPATETLTDIQVARIMVNLYQNNVQCRNSINSIKTFLENAKKAVDAGEEPPTSRPQ